MKAVILAGGFGTRISEETQTVPKPMIKIGGKPILWHLMNWYASHDVNDFVICCGHKSYAIKEYFANYFLHTSDVTFNLEDNSMLVHKKRAEPWTVTLVETGENTMTGGRIKRITDYVKNEKSFCLTYGDGLGDVDITKLINFHNEHGKKATLTAVHPAGRFGALDISGSKVNSFKEKPKGDGFRVNGGFFVLSPEVISLIEDDQTVWEEGPLEKLASSGELNSFSHDGFWQPMDTLRDMNLLEKLWNDGSAPWACPNE
jgi:glucose-1-phosphate cytidylyltransferase